MIEYIQTVPFPILVVLYVLIGFIWKDILIWFRNNYVPNVGFSNLSQAVTVVFWPVSMVIFTVGMIIGIVSYFKAKGNE